MTATTEQEAREQTAALTFVGVMGLILGGAGVVLAAVAVALDYGLKRDPNRERARGDWWRQSVADSEAWLAQDRAKRQAWREARRQWWKDGADPKKRPRKPSAEVRLGAWMRRSYARSTVSANRTGGVVGRFWRGWLAGWSAANEVRRDGGGFRDIAKARPERPETPEAVTDPPPQEAKESTKATAPPTEAEASTSNTAELAPNQATEVAAQEVYDLKAGVQRIIDTELARRAALSPEAAAAEEAERAAFNRARATEEAEKLRQLGVAPVSPSGSDGASPETQGTNDQGAGDQKMTAPVGETHLDLTAQGLNEINQTLAQVDEANDALGALRAKLQGQIAELNERVTVNGGTAATQQALDQANAVVQMIGQHVGGLADASAEAADTTAAAEAGLAPARDAQDALHSSGARGEFVSTATS